MPKQLTAERKAQLKEAKRRYRAKQKAKKIAAKGPKHRVAKPVAKKQGFRVQGKKFFVTWAQTDGTKEALLNFIQKTATSPVIKYIIAKEKHEDGSPHFHAYFETARVWQIKKADTLDWNGNHPKIEKAKSEGAAMHYCKKEGDYLTNMTFDSYKRAKDLAVAGNWKAACALIMNEQPEDAAKYMDKFIKNFKLMAEINNRINNPVVPKYTSEQFKPVECDYDDKKLALVVSGPSGIGKTQWVKSKYANPLLVRHMDKLKQFDKNEHDAIIFDDMSFAHYPREACIHILDLDEDADINVKCSMVTIPAGTPRVFTTNRDPTEIFSASDKAIWRRYKALRLTEDIRLNPHEDGATAMLKVAPEDTKIDIPDLEDILN